MNRDRWRPSTGSPVSARRAVGADAIEASVDALVTVDPGFRVTDVNEQTVRITGYSREELIGSPFPDYFTDPELATAGVGQTLAEGTIIVALTAYAMKGDEERVLEAGCDGYVAKPLDTRTFPALVASYLA